MSNQIIDRQRELMREKGLDVIVIISPENVAWTSGIAVPSQKIVRHRHAMVLVPREGECEMVVVSIEEGFVKARTEMPVIAYNEFTQKAIPALVTRLVDRNLAAARIGLEVSYLNHLDYCRLTQALPHAQIVPVDELLDELRMIKTPDEVRRLTHAARLAERVAHRSLQSWWPGMTELDLGRIITDNFAAAGGEKLTMLAVTAGERTPMLNSGPTSREIKHGEVVRIDVIGTVDNYYCDVARTAVVGTPTAEVQSIWQKLVDCRDMALGLIRPGASPQDIFKMYIDKMNAWGLPTLNFLGHGLGLTLHEEPYLNCYRDCTLREGMVLAIEPLVVFPNLGMQLEEAVIVTRDGCEVVTNQFDIRKLWCMNETHREGVAAAAVSHA